MHLTNVEPFNREIESLSNCKIGIVKTKKKFSWGCEQRAALDESVEEMSLLQSQLALERFSRKTLTHHYWPQGLVLTPPTNKRPLADDDWLNWDEKKATYFGLAAQFYGLFAPWLHVKLFPKGFRKHF